MLDPLNCLEDPRARYSPGGAMDFAALERRRRSRRDFPAMVNAVESLVILGYSHDDVRLVAANAR